MTKVVNKHDDKYDIYIGRGSLFGNDFIIGRDGTREEVIEKYSQKFAKRIISNESNFRIEVLKIKNKILGCFCKTKAEPERPCHGDIIKKYLDEKNGLAIIGSRTFNDYAALLRIWEKYFEGNFDYVVSGGAAGVDSLGKLLAQEMRLDYVEFPPDWDKFGKAAGFIRNQDIINNCNAVLAIWQNNSKGTASSIELAKKMKKPSFIFYV